LIVTPDFENDIVAAIYKIIDGELPIQDFIQYFSLAIDAESVDRNGTEKGEGECQMRPTFVNRLPDR